MCYDSEGHNASAKSNGLCGYNSSTADAEDSFSQDQHAPYLRSGRGHRNISSGTPMHWARVGGVRLLK